MWWLSHVAAGANLSQSRAMNQCFLFVSGCQKPLHIQAPKRAMTTRKVDLDSLCASISLATASDHYFSFYAHAVIVCYWPRRLQTYSLIL